MAASHSNPFSPPEQRALLDLARESVHCAVHRGTAAAVAIDHYGDRLRERAAAFVTLNRRGSLRGCIGTLAADDPLVETVAENAFRAALHDPRFPPVSIAELEQLEIDISVLTAPEPWTVADETELLAGLEPGRDGLILGVGQRRATFLPSVWAQLPRPAEFVRHLKLKAGLPADFWSSEVVVARYQAHLVGETTAAWR